MLRVSELQLRAAGFLYATPQAYGPRDEHRWFMRNVMVLSSGSTLGQALNIALAPLLTRLYLPSNLGEFALFAAFINVAAVAASLRYELAIVSAQDECEAARLTLCSIVLAIPTSAIAALSFYGLVSCRLLGYETMPLYAAIIAIPALLLTSTFSALRYWSLRNERFGLISRGTVFQNVSRALSQVALGCFGPHTSGLLAGEIIGRCSGMGRMLCAAYQTLKRNLGTSSWHDFKDALKKNRQFALYSLPSSLLDALSATISVPLVVSLYGVQSGGNYALAWQVLALPSTVITSSVADAFHSRAALTFRQDPSSLSGLVKRLAGTLLIIGIFPAAVLIAFGPRLFGMIFGGRWLEAGAIAALVAPWFLAQFVVSPLSRVVEVAKRQQKKFIFDFISLTGTIVVFAVAHDRQWQLTTAIAALTGVKTAAYFTFFFIILRVASEEHQTASLPNV